MGFGYIIQNCLRLMHFSLGERTAMRWKTLRIRPFICVRPFIYLRPFILVFVFLVIHTDNVPAVLMPKFLYPDPATLHTKPPFLRHSLRQALHILRQKHRPIHTSICAALDASLLCTVQLIRRRRTCDALPKAAIGQGVESLWRTISISPVQISEANVFQRRHGRQRTYCRQQFFCC